MAIKLNDSHFTDGDIVYAEDLDDTFDYIEKFVDMTCAFSYTGSGQVSTIAYSGTAGSGSAFSGTLTCTYGTSGTEEDRLIQVAKEFDGATETTTIAYNADATTGTLTKVIS